MKRKFNKAIRLFIMLIFTMFLLSACGGEHSAKLVNEISFSLENITDLKISYDDENIIFFTSGDENLVIKEYMSKDKKSYHARVSQDKNSIRISEGGKPLLKGGFTRYVEVYLPDAYTEDLQVAATNGNIDMSDMEVDVHSIRVDCTSGTFQIGKASAEEIYFSTTSGRFELGELVGEQIRIESTQGNVTCERLQGKVNYISTGGNAEFFSAAGEGIYQVNNSGKLSVVYEEVTGDLSFYNKNDTIEVQLPEALSFEFEAVTKNGAVNTDFQGDISVNGDSVNGTVGVNPTVSIKAETKNGNIEVRR